LKAWSLASLGAARLESQRPLFGSPKGCPGHILGHHLVGGFNTSEHIKVSWDDDIPNIYGKIENVPNHQPVYISK